MSLLPPSTITFTVAQLRSFLEHTAEQFVLQKKSISDEDSALVKSIFLFATSSDNLASFEKKRKQLVPARHTEVVANEQAIIVPSTKSGFSSAGKVKSTPTRVNLMTSKHRIVPMETQLSTALNILSSPDAINKAH